MFSFSRNIKVYLAVGSTNMRKSNIGERIFLKNNGEHNETKI